MQFTRIVAIRHGETAWNKDTRLQGHLDIALNETGRWQAQRVAPLLQPGARFRIGQGIEHQARIGLELLHDAVKVLAPVFASAPVPLTVPKYTVLV